MIHDVSKTGGTGRIRVLWLIKGLERGGAENLLYLMVQAADRERFHYETAYLQRASHALVADLEGEGMAVHCLEMASELRLGWVLRLRRLLQERHYDVVHVHSPYVAAFARAMVRSLPPRRRPKLVTTEHNIWPNYALATRVANAVTYRVDDAHIAVSRAVLESIPRILRSDTEVVVHGIRLEDIREQRQHRETVRKELNIREDEVLIGAVANYRREKGYHDLLTAARQVVDSGAPVKFVAIGGGALEAEIRGFRDRLELQGHVHLLGYRDDALRLLSGCDVFALASLQEGFPIAVMEALAMGIPVVATSVGGVPDAITDRVEGLMVPPARPDLLADALILLVRDAALRARLAAAARTRGEQFDITVATRRVESLYSRLAEERAAKPEDVSSPP